MKTLEYTKELRCCANCRFGECDCEPELNDMSGYNLKDYWTWGIVICRFNPPTPICDETGDDIVLFPSMPGDGWCYQFQSKYGVS